MWRQMKAHTLLDPARPEVEPNELLRQRQGAMLDPDSVSHNCPYCLDTMAWDLFVAHWASCLKRWAHMRDVTRKRFTGATLEVDDDG